MEYLLIILYGITLIYFAQSERVIKFIVLLGIQGFLLFVIAFYNLIHINTIGLALILLETIVVKTIAIPYVLNRIRKHNNLKHVYECSIPVFYSIILIAFIIIGSFVVNSTMLNIPVKSKFFSIAIASVLSGIMFVVMHKNVFSHLIGYLIIENGIFLLSVSVGGEMPILISLAVLIDIFIGFLVIGVFLNKIGDTFKDINIDNLSQLKD